MSMDWFRSWHGAPTDPKWLVVAKRAETLPCFVSAIVWALFDHASQNSDDRGNVVGFDIETYAVFAGVDEALVDRVIYALQEKNIIVDGRLANWERRQTKGGATSTERVQKHRNKLKRDVTHVTHETLRNDREDKIREEERREDKTHSPSDETVTAIDDRPSPSKQTSPPAETPLFGDLGQDQTPLPRARGTAVAVVDDARRQQALALADARRREADAHLAGFETWWQAYPKKASKGGAKKKYAELIKGRQVTETELLDGALRYAADRAGQDPRYTKHPTTWLNNSCWLDEPAKPPDVGGFGMLSSTSQRFLQNSAYLKDQQ